MKFLTANFLIILFFITASAMEYTKEMDLINVAITTKNNQELKEEIKKNPSLVNTLIGKFLPLNLAIIYGNLEAARILLSAGANCTLPDKNNNSSINYFSINTLKTPQDKIQLLDALIEAGADCNTPNDNGYTPLHGAASDYEPIILKRLIELGADINARTKKLCTPLHLIRYDLDSTESLKIVVAHGAHINAQDDQGLTPIRIAIKKNAINCVKLFLSLPGIKTSILNKDGKSDLDTAKEEGHKAIGQLLIEHLGVYSAQGLISRQGFAQILPQEIAEHIATFLFREYTRN